MRKKITIISFLITIIIELFVALALAGVLFKNNGVETCKDCVYARYKDKKQVGDKLVNYYNDYKKIDNKLFIGHKLDDVDNIITGYICSKSNNEVYCLEGSNDDSKYISNVKILAKIFGEDNCSQSYAALESIDGQSKTYASYKCQNDNEYVTVRSNGSIKLEINKSNGCYYNSDGMYCY